jgi:transposase InsO family protein
MNDNKVSTMQLTSYTLSDGNWQLWRKEIVISMRCIDAYEIMIGTEPRPSPIIKQSPSSSSDEQELTAANARLVQATHAHRNAKALALSSPSEDVLQDQLAQAETALDQALTAYTNAMEKKPSTEKPLAKNDWNRRHDQAYRSLQMSLSEPFKELTYDCMDLPSTWQTLQNHFESKAAADVMAAESQLEQLRLGDNDDVLDFLNNIRLIRSKLTSSGAPISDRKLFLTVIRKLPKKMQTIQDTILYGSDDRRTYAILEQTLMSYAKNNPKAQVPDQANLATTTRDKTCNYCKRKGHLKAECHARQHTCQRCGGVGHFEKRCKDKTQDKQAEKNKTSRTPETNYAFSVGDRNTTAWIVDTGASTSISPDITPDTKTSETITMANGTTMPVTGKGRADVGFLITSVLHVSQSNKNLLSIGKTCDDGDIDSATFNRTGCLLYKSGRVVATGTRRNGLYELDAAAVSHNINLASASSDIWHQRLAHCPLQVLKEIVNHKIADGIQVSSIKDDSEHRCEACETGKATRLPFPSRDPDKKSSLPGRVLHVDLCGPMRTISIQGNRYVMPVTDECSRFVTTFYMPKKSDAAELLLKCIDQYENYTGNRVNIVQSDNGGEFTSTFLRKKLAIKGIRLQTTVAYTPEQNGIAERMNRTLMDRARTMLINAGLNTKYWQFAMRASTHLTNRLPTNANDRRSPFEVWTGSKPDIQHLRVFGCRAYSHIPDQKRYKFDPKANICTFLGYALDQKGYILQNDADGTTFVSRDVKFDESFMPHKQSNLVDGRSGKGETNVSPPKFVAFPEPLPTPSSTAANDQVQDLLERAADNAADNSNKSGETTPQSDDEMNDDDDDYKDEEYQDDNERRRPKCAQPILPAHLGDGQPPYTCQDDTDIESTATDRETAAQPTAGRIDLETPSSYSAPTSTSQHSKSKKANQRRGSFSSLTESARRKLSSSSRIVSKPARLDFEQEDERARQLARRQAKHRSVHHALVIVEPRSYTEATSCSQKDEWRIAMKNEYDSLIDNQTWTLCQLPSNRKAIRSKWVFKTKTKADGTIDRFKARLVAQGFSQRHGIDFDETFSPVASMPTIRILLSLQALNWHVRHIDVDTAYLNANLDVELYISQPEGFEVVNDNGGKLVCRLKKAIYGLKQAGLAWYNHLVNLLQSLKFTTSTSDKCLFIKQSRNPIFIASYVDDLIIASPSLDSILQFESDLQQRLKIKILGDVEHILGWKVTYDKDIGVSITQESYISHILEQYGMSDCNPVRTPTVKGQQTDSTVTDDDVGFPYREVVGSLLYISNSCRPDIAQATHFAARFVSNPNRHHVQSVKRILRYLKGTINVGIRFKPSTSYRLEGYADADYVNNLTDARSTSGFVFISNGPLSWKSRRQHLTALSTTEAELIALSEAVKEASWLSSLLKEMKLICASYKIPVHEDNAGCLALVTGKRTPARTKHQAVRIGFVRDMIGLGVINVVRCATADMIADPLTKPLGYIDFKRKFEDILYIPEITTCSPEGECRDPSRPQTT